jgi:hypothetical protein
MKHFPLIIALLVAFAFGWVLRSCNGKKSHYAPPIKVTEYLTKVDTFKKEVTRLKTRLKVVNVHDTVEVLQQVAIRDTIILKQDSIITKQDTVIRYLIASDSLRADTIQGLSKDVKRERFWKRTFGGAAAVGWLILLL